MHARNINTRYVRLIDCSPANILRRNGVCVAAVSATGADKEGLGAAMASADAVTLRTPAEGVVRINESDRDSELLCLIGNKALQLTKAPGMQTSPLLLQDPYPGTNPLEIFQGNPAAGALGNGNYLFGNLMIDVTRETFFFPSALAQKPFDRAGAFGRELRAKPAMSRSEAVQMTARKAVVVTGVGNRRQPKIDPKPVLDFRFRWLRKFNASKELPQAISAKEIAARAGAPAEEGNGKPSRKGCAHQRLSNRGKDALPLSIQFVAVSPL